jgi:hypothetical protein
MSIRIIWSPADDDGCRFSHPRRRRATDYIKTRGVDRKILISTIINFFIRDLARHHGRVARTFDRIDPSLPCRWRGGRLGHHGRGVFAGFAGWCVLWLSSRDVTRSSYVAFGTKKTKGGAGAGNILSHIGVHHTRSLFSAKGKRCGPQHLYHPVL